MKYSFASDSEPTDEQLEQLMKEVLEGVIARRKEADRALKAQMEYERIQSKANADKYRNAAKKS